MKYILGLVTIGLLFSGCQCGGGTSGEPYYRICDDNSCSDTLDYTKDGDCITYIQLFSSNWKTSCGEYRIYYENGAKPKINSNLGKV